MATANRWAMSDRRIFTALGLVVVGLFITCCGFGMSSSPIGGLGIAIGVLGPGFIVLSSVRGNVREYVYGSAHVHSASPPPQAGASGRCDIHLLVHAHGVNGVVVRVRDPSVPVSKWPDTGATLPVVIPNGNARRTQVLWDQVRTHADIAAAGDAYVEDDYASDDAYPLHVNESGASLTVDETFSAEAFADVDANAQAEASEFEVPAQRVDATALPEDRGGTPAQAAAAPDIPPQTPPRRPSPHPSPRPRRPSDVDAADGEGAVAHSPVPPPPPPPSPPRSSPPQPAPPTAQASPPPPAEMPRVVELLVSPFAKKSPPARPERPTQPSSSPPPPSPAGPNAGPDRESGAGKLATGELGAGASRGASVAEPEVTATPKQQTMPGPDRNGGTSVAAYRGNSRRPANASRSDNGVHGVSVTLIVKNLQRSLTFYRDTVGLDEVDSGADNAVLASGTARILLRSVSDMQPVDRRVVHLNLEVADVHAEYERLRTAGVTFVQPPRAVSKGEQLEQWAATFRDPDGHAISLVRWEIRRNN